MSSLPNTDQITVAVITGGHSFDVPAFHAVFRGMVTVDAYIQHLDNFVADVGKVRDKYDVILFYHMPMETPAEASRKREVLESLQASEQGLFLLHHSILAYPEWSMWNEMVGIQDRRFGYHMEIDLHVDVVNSDHPITHGLSDWDMVDETYTMNSPGEDSQHLLKVAHDKSMKTIAWTRDFGKARVFCFQSGHDNQTYVDPRFQQVIMRGIEWCAGRI